jgi:capsular polysaccharide biosynthesis protein
VVAAIITLPALLTAEQPTSGGYSTVIRYTASQVLSAIPRQTGDYQDIWLASELTVNAFTEWIRSTRFADEVNAVLARDGWNLDTIGHFTSANERSIGQIFIGWDNPDELQDIVYAAIEVLQTRSSDYFPQLGDTPAQVKVLDTPYISPAPPPITNRLRPLLQLGVALLAGIGLAFLVEYLDPTLYRREQLEALDLPVIASVPPE